MNELESVIPDGPYCYDHLIMDFMGIGKLVKLCPYYRNEGEIVTCVYCGVSDDPILDDQVKVCGIRDNI